MKTLNELALKHGTDKSSETHYYTLMYENLLKNRTVNNMLEIGLGSGASALMWSEYFPEANIYIMEYFDQENKEKWNSPQISAHNLTILQGDSTKIESWKEVPYELDFIVDDGSHYPNDQILTFQNGFNHLKSHGLYFIEDTHCNFSLQYTGGKDIIYNWVLNLVFNQQLPKYGNTDGNFYFLRGLMPIPIRDIYSYHFYKSVIVFEKA
jgi:8-demethyl-8-(2-methoxy-alpha-L-rhamnosyl)tetracenomycin-C 3'-O-methyltransferase